MQPESLEVLEQADVPPVQARAIVRAIEIELAGSKDTLATKHDLLLLRQDVRQAISEVRAELLAAMAGLRAEMSAETSKVRGEMSGLRAEMSAETSKVRGEMSGLRAEMSAETSKVPGEMSGLRAEIRAEMSELRGELRAEIHAGASSTTRQMYAALLGQTAVLLGFAYFFATHIR